MSLNKVNCDGGRLTLHGDYVVKHSTDIEFSLEGDRVPSHMKGNRKGDAFLTTKLVIFTAKDRSPNFQNFAMAFQSMRNIEVKQPIFGANAITGYVISEQLGGWEGNANFKFTFSTGGAIEFAEALKRAVVQAQRTPAAHSAPPPMAAYYPPQQPQGYQYVPQPNGYPMQGAGYYPPQGTAQGPPPGVMPMQGQAPPPYQAAYYPETANAGDAKAREAYSSGQNVYIPNTNEAPPPYNPNYDKKSQ